MTNHRRVSAIPSLQSHLVVGIGYRRGTGREMSDVIVLLIVAPVWEIRRPLWSHVHCDRYDPVHRFNSGALVTRD
jgi:hypothetical protein